MTKSESLPRDRDAWLEQELYSFDLTQGRQVPWTVREAVTGTQIFGGTGSGKTSGSGYNLAKAMLEAGFGGLVLTAKPDELENWQRYFRDARGRRAEAEEDGLAVLSPESGHTFNPLAYEFELSRGNTQRVVSLFMTALGSGEGGAGKDPYWTDALRELLTHAVDLVAFSTGEIAGGKLKLPETIRLMDLVEIVRSAPQSPEDVQAQLKPSYKPPARSCLRRIRDAEVCCSTLSDAAELSDLRDTVAYWLGDFPNLADRTRSVIVSSFTSKSVDMLRRTLRPLLCMDTSPEVRPEATFRGKVVVVNLPVKTFGEVGRFAQVLYKTVWQHTVESELRTLEPGSGWRPVFLWADEAQYFVSPDDLAFQQTARSKLAATVYLTQNISNYYTVLGGASSSATDSLLGSLQTKVFHQNSDPATNEWAERLFARKEKTKTVVVSKGDVAKDNRSEQRPMWESEVPAHTFTVLDRGGPESNNKVDSRIFFPHQAGIQAKKNWIGHEFQQPTLHIQSTG